MAFSITLGSATTKITRDEETFVFYHYEPSMAGAVIFVILFASSSFFHCWQAVRSRTWFMIPYIIVGFLEAVGYGGRGASATENPGPYTKNPYIVQSVLLLVAPALLAASIYMELGRIVQMVDGEQALFIRRKFLTKVFVGGDVLSFFLQAAGASLIVSSSSGGSTGRNVIVVGLLVQIVFFAIFVIAACTFHARLNKRPSMKTVTAPWKPHMRALYAVSVLIFVRSIVRVAEYVQGNDGHIITHEAFLYVFDALVIFLAMVTLNWRHPGEISRYLIAMRTDAGALCLG